MDEFWYRHQNKNLLTFQEVILSSFVRITKSMDHLDMKSGFVYIITNKRNTVLYVGVTSELKARIYDHKRGVGCKFSAKYKLNKLVWFDEFPRMREALDREKQIKNWKREWKFNLIKDFNSELKDLYDDV